MSAVHNTHAAAVEIGGGGGRQPPEDETVWQWAAVSPSRPVAPDARA